MILAIWVYLFLIEDIFTTKNIMDQPAGTGRRERSEQWTRFGQSADMVVYSLQEWRLKLLQCMQYKTWIIRVENLEPYRDFRYIDTSR